MENVLWMGIRKSTFEDEFKTISVGDGTQVYPNDHHIWESGQPNGRANSLQNCAVLHPSSAGRFMLLFVRFKVFRASTEVGEQIGQTRFL